MFSDAFNDAMTDLISQKKIVSFSKKEEEALCANYLKRFPRYLFKHGAEYPQKSHN